MDKAVKEESGNIFIPDTKAGFVLPNSQAHSVMFRRLRQSTHANRHHLQEKKVPAEVNIIMLQPASIKINN